MYTCVQEEVCLLLYSIVVCLGCYIHITLQCDGDKLVLICLGVNVVYRLVFCDIIHQRYYGRTTYVNIKVAIVYEI